MAIARIKRIELIASKQEKDSLLDLLQRQAKIQLIPAETETTQSFLPGEANESSLSEIEEAITFLITFSRQSNFLESMTNLKPFISQQDIKTTISAFPWRDKLNELTRLRARLKDIAHEKDQLAQRKLLLAPWQSLDIPLAELKAGVRCDMQLGSMPTRDYTKFLSQCVEGEVEFYHCVVKQTSNTIFLILIYHKSMFAELEKILKNLSFTVSALGDEAATIKELLAGIENENFRLQEQNKDTAEQINAFNEDIFRLKMVYHYLASGYKIREAGRDLVQQQYTFSLSGWIRQADILDLEKEILAHGHEIALFFSDPAPDDDVPVILQNRKLVQPFEFITQIYGMPKYNEIDPTPFLAPFFFIYFGFCVSDAGYGLVLTLFSWLVLKKFKLGPTGTRFWKMFRYCGLSTIIVGAITGSWFGNLPDLLAENSRFFVPFKRFTDSLIIIDPFRETTKLLGIALIFGIVQIWFGSIVAALGNWKNRRYLDILYDQVPTLIFLFGITGLAMIFLNMGISMPAVVFQYAAICGAIVLILTQGRAEKGIGAKLFYGIYNFYMTLSGYLSDTLSYSRLWALALVTGVMAMTINLLTINFGRMISAAIPLISKIPLLKTLISIVIMVVIFVLGHLGSFLMNLLGAFVHPLRLQYVEFFSKFFKPGGERFRAFRADNKYFNVK